jgi:hypothetical protein
MGTGVRIFFFDDDDTIHRISLARFQRLLQCDPKERILAYRAKRIRCAIVALEIAQRKPVAVKRIDYFRLYFDGEGRIDTNQLKREKQLAAETLPPLFDRQEPSRIIDAKHLFAKRRYEYRYMWRPSAELEASILDKVMS